MNTIGNNIKKLRTSRGMTQQKLADIVGAKNYTTISKWESGANSPQGKDLIVLSKLFNVSIDSILGIDDKIKTVLKSHSYNYFPTAISAGLPLNVEGIQSDDVDRIEIPDSIMGKWSGSKDIFLTRVNGESMNRVIPDKSLIAVKPISLSNLKNGDIVVYSDGNDYAVKRFYQYDDTIIFRPDSYDPRFTDYQTTADSDLKIHGKVVLYIVELD